jgi:hypothetical protein
VGSRWDSVLALSSDWLSQPSIESLRREAVEIVAAEFGDARLAVLKDPRLCRLLLFWRDIVVTAGFAPSAVLMVRRPMEVAASLARRDQFAPEKSLALWFEHLVDAERNSRDMPRATIATMRCSPTPPTRRARVRRRSVPAQAKSGPAQGADDLVRPDLKRQHYGGPKRAARESLASGLDMVLDAGYAKIAELPPGKDPQAAVTALAHSARAALAAAMASGGSRRNWRRRRPRRARSGSRDDPAQHAWSSRPTSAARSAHKARDEIEAALRARTDELCLDARGPASIRESVKAEIVSISTTGIGTAERELRDHVARLQKELVDERATIARLAEQIDHARLASDNQQMQIDGAPPYRDELVGQIEIARQAHATRDVQEAALQQTSTPRTWADARRRVQRDQDRARRDGGQVQDARPRGRDAAPRLRGLPTRARHARRDREADGEALTALTSELDRRGRGARTHRRSYAARAARARGTRAYRTARGPAGRSGGARTVARSNFDAAASKPRATRRALAGPLARRVAQA